MSEEKYYTLDATISCEQQHLLAELDHDGVEEYAIDEAEVDRLLGEKAFSGGDVDEQTIALIEQQLEQDRFRIYFHTGQAGERAQKALKFLQQHDIVCEQIEHDEKDWNENWRQGYETVKISKNLWIVPSWLKESQEVPEGTTALYLYPGQGFGTGRHETTALCLQLFEQRKYNGKTVLDFGCGSGILGIAAKLRYDCHVDYMDIDASALENTRQNLSENDISVQDSQVILRSEFMPGQKRYDLVFANILLEILIKEKDAIIASLSPGAYLIVSGLLNEHVEAFRENYTELQELSVVSQGDWSAIELLAP
ncbi:MAG: hypothetical protein CME71_05450 [Halobacteriovorax sp.]|nr:hypothetical protein [Halobacteriovorax sp.]